MVRSFRPRSTCGCHILILDFKKAFDSVPHQRLLSKLKSYGISGNLLAWIESFLKDRNQRVLINGVNSSWTRVKSGIPQDSVLGPLLFSIFVNDLPTTLQSDCLLFANDCKLFCSLVDDDSVDQLQNDLNRLQSWSLLWQLPFNVSKCRVLHLGRTNTNHTYYMNSEPLQNVNEEKDLGIINLNFIAMFLQFLVKQGNCWP